MTDSYITVGDGVTGFIGPDATRLLHARTVKHALRACKLGFRLTRTATPTRTFYLASRITGKTYKRGQYDLAIADVNQWIWAMEAGDQGRVESPDRAPLIARDAPTMSPGPFGPGLFGGPV
jgi:hypothetical protein